MKPNKQRNVYFWFIFHLTYMTCLENVFYTESDFDFQSVIFKDNFNAFYWGYSHRHGKKVIINTFPYRVFKVVDLFYFLCSIDAYLRIESQYLLPIIGVSFKGDLMVIYYEAEETEIINWEKVSNNNYMDILMSISLGIEHLHENLIPHYRIKPDSVFKVNNSYKIGMIRPPTFLNLEESDYEFITLNTTGEQYDSFSFGLLVGSLISGKKPQDIMKEFWEFKDIDFGDSPLGLVTKRCLSLSPKQRPSFSEILAMMMINPKEDNVFPNGNHSEKIDRLNTSGVFSFLETRSKNGCLLSSLIIGTMYSSGEVVMKSLENARKCLEMCIEKGEAIAMNNLAKILYSEDKEKSMNLLIDSANKGYAIAHINYGKILAKPIDRKDNSPDTLKKWFLVASHYHKAADQGSVEGMCYYANIIQFRDMEEHFRYLRKAARRGDTLAIHMTGLCYEKGKGVEENREIMLKYFNYGAGLNSPISMNNIGTNTPDIDQSISLWKKAAESGVKHSQYNLGISHIRGRGVPQDFEEAFKWMLKSAEQHFYPACFNVALMYRDGIGTEKNEEKAEEWCRIGNNEWLALTSKGQLYEERRKIAKLTMIENQED